MTEMAEVASHTVSRFETEQGELRHDTATKLEAAFAEPGVNPPLMRIPELASIVSHSNQKQGTHRVGIRAHSACPQQL